MLDSHMWLIWNRPGRGGHTKHAPRSWRAKLLHQHRALDLKPRIQTTVLRALDSKPQTPNPQPRCLNPTP